MVLLPGTVATLKRTLALAEALSHHRPCRCRVASDTGLLVGADLRVAIGFQLGSRAGVSGRVDWRCKILKSNPEYR